ncbi:2Fe-2S iron-sulfur cluster-binding protein [Ramlibacter sp. Leaf400]|uniref:2Fe-2S iron-sulfur cluster-binding protein n=1 Tax=Ramlibacter sp. Leaf400 TaxID=1736365 RepID=UPI0009EB9798|nr:2Fe-2S iron-sulfur cluster-binding protein [Ramlibacter sp. Leaf400]
MDEQDHGAVAVWRVTLGVGGPTFDAPEDQPLMRSAEAAGWPMASSCRNGTCRTCMQRMLSGEVRYRIDWPGVLAEERREGWVLPCVAHPAADIVLE